jgi:hypothetical protein
MPSPDRHFATAAIFTQSTGLTPNSGDAALYIKSDNKAYIKDSAGSEVIVGGTGTIAGTLGTVDNAVPRADGTGGITAQGSDIVIDDATTSTANNVAITNQHTGQTNSALVLTPKGTGAFIVGLKPDGTNTGGNARGTNAVDLQTTRSVATQVASGTRSFIGGGERNIASNTNNVVSGGYQNTASGGFSNIIPSAVCGGGQNTANSMGSFVGGGRSNAASNDYSIVGSGYSNNASGNASVVCGGGIGGGDIGAGNTASGTWSAILGGSAALANRTGMQAHAVGQFAAQGDAQRARFVLRNKTTTNAAVELFLNGSTTRLTIPSGKYLTGTINIAGIKSDGATAARYIRQFSIKNVAATTSLVGTVDTVGTDIANSTTISITADDTNDALKVEVTGIASETWRWVASVDVVEVAYGT